MPKSERKDAYFTKLLNFSKAYKKILVVLADNVGSHHMQKIRLDLRGKAEILMGKNTLMRKAIRDNLKENPKLEALLPYLKDNIGLVFTNGNLSEIKKQVVGNTVNAPAKAGTLAPNDVIVPAGDTGLEPTQTAFLQALNIASKINKGQVQISNDVHLLKPGDKVGPSEAQLLQKLNIKPFKYGLKVVKVYDDGTIYDPVVLDLSDEDIIAKFRSGVANIAAISLEIGYPTVASVPHSLLNGFKSILAIGLEAKLSFAALDKVQAAIAGGAAAASAAPAAAAAAQAPAAETKKVEEPAEEESVEVSDLFGGGDDW